MQTVVFKLAAAGSINIMDTIVGYVRYYARTAGGGIDPRIRVRSLGGGASAELMPGDAYRMAAPHRGLVVENLSGEAIEGKLSIAPDQSSIDVGQLSGVVEVVDGEKTRTLAGGMFMGQAVINGVAGQFAALQLYNPAGSGKNLVVNQMQLGSVVASQAAVGYLVAPLANDFTATAVGNKKSDGAIGVAELRGQQQVAAMLGNAFAQYYLMPVQTFQWAVRGGVVITPGAGLTVQNSTVGGSLLVNFEWFEDAQL